MDLFQLDENKQLIPLTYVLCHADKRPIDTLYPVYDFNFNNKSNDTFEISFKYHSLTDGEFNELYNELIDFKLVYIPEWKKYYQLAVSETEGEEGSYKSVSGIHLSEAELSQLNLDEIEINTELDIARTDYEITYIYYEEKPEQSLLHRILKDKAPHYTVKYVSPSIAKLVRSFSISGTTINDFLRGELAEELNCIVEYDSYDNTISLIDTLKVCKDCGHREDYNEDTCPECGSANVYTEYGKETGIIISTENLATELTINTDKDSVKTCFKVSGGDEIMTAAIRAINPNGTQYIYNFSKEMLADMPPELVEKIENYNKEYTTLAPTYKQVMTEIYDLYDEILYYKSEMMPTSAPIDTTAALEVKKMNVSNLGTIGISSTLSRNTSVTIVNNAILSLAKLLLNPGYSVELKETQYIYDPLGCKWTGRFYVYNNAYPDKTDENNPDPPTLGETITLALTNDYKTFVEQKLKKALGKQEALDIYTDPRGDKRWDKYSLNRLSAFHSAYQSCLDILISQGIDDITPSGKICKDLYNSYYFDLKNIEAEINVRQSTIDLLNNKLTVKESEQVRINTILNFEAYIGKELYNSFCSYRRDDSYENSNYISDGLSNSELLDKAEELLEKANIELYKASQTQYTISGNVGNFLLMPEFEHIHSDCELGNWIYVLTKYKDVYKLRINNISGNHNSIENIDLEFSNAYKVGDPVIDALTDTIAKASSMASSYSYVVRQAEQGEIASKTIEEMREDGLSAAKYRIVNADEQSITIDEHGLLGKEYDDITDEYSPEQVKLINNLLCFTQDNWENVETALGKITYTDPKTKASVSKYGLIVDTVISGKLYGNELIGGAIYSSNYWDKDANGTYIGLDDGTFSFAGGKMQYTGNKLLLRDVTIEWASTNSPDVEIDDVTGLNEFLNEYQDELDAIAEQADLKAETWYQAEDPSVNWTTVEDKELHLGDIWYDTVNNTTSIYAIKEGTYFWEELNTNIPDDLYDKIDSKSSIYVVKPLYYNQHDLLIPNSTFEIDGITFNEGAVYKAVIPEGEFRDYTLDDNGNIIDKFVATDWIEIGYATPSYVDEKVNVLEQELIEGKYKGQDGKTYYFYVKYSANADGSDMTETPQDNSIYMGVCSTEETPAPTEPDRYTWSLIKGSDGEKGEKGEPGTSGTSSYLHIKYSDDGLTFTNNNGETVGTYIGTYVDDNEEDSTVFSRYTWKKFVGEDGTGIESSEITYQISESGTIVPTGEWLKNIPETTTDKSYLWTKTYIKYTNDGGSTTSYSVSKIGIDGKDGSNGSDGVGISEVINYYLATSASSGVTTSTSGWTTTIQTITSDKKYLWNYEEITYTNSTKTSTVPVIIGTYGRDGTNGKDGNNGADGRGIVSITEKYLVSSQSTGITTSTSGWKDTMQLTDTTNKYLWNYEIITYTDETTDATEPIIIGVHGATGSDGVGVSEVVEEYCLSTSNTTPTETWSNIMPEWSSGKYIWIRQKITWDDNNITYTTPTLAKAINSANVTANNANTTATTANTKADNAVTTANTANTNASKAVSTANATSEALTTFQNNVQGALGLGTTTITEDSVISPKIGGGYLYIASDDYSVAIDPNNTGGQSGDRIFRIATADNTKEVMFIDNQGNGYFSGRIAANGGEIGGWFIDTNAIYNGIGFTNTKTSNSTGMGTYGGDWAFWAGDGKFWVKQTGEIYSESGTIGGWKIKNNCIYNGVDFTDMVEEDIWKNPTSTGIGMWNDAPWAFWAGNGRFSVTQEGKVSINYDGNISDKIVSLTYTTANETFQLNAETYLMSTGLVSNSNYYYIGKDLNTKHSSSIGQDGVVSYYEEVGNYNISSRLTNGALSFYFNSGLVGYIEGVSDDSIQYNATNYHLFKNGLVQFDNAVYMFGGLYSAFGGQDHLSDERIKYSMKILDETQTANFVYSLKPTEYKYILEKEERIHHGFIAQQVKASMGNNEWALYRDNSDNKNIPEEFRYLTLCYEELIADIVSTLQSQNKRILKLETQLNI